MITFLIGSFLGGTVGVFGMALFAGQSYEKGYITGFQKAFDEGKKAKEEFVQERRNQNG
jgi:hypothetical protein